MRFFTVYGPMGRPDMALFKFTKSILDSKKINIFNKGNHSRDFTYVEDVAESIMRLIKKPSKDKIPYQILNIASDNPQKLKKFISIIEKYVGLKAKANLLPLQKGDVGKTHADISKLIDKINYKPQTSLQYGIENFINWYKKYYK